MKRIYYIIGLLIFGLISFKPVNNYLIELERQEHEQYVNRLNSYHSFYESSRKLPKDQRPDLRGLREHLMTVDLSEKRVPKERLIEAIKETEERKSTYAFRNRMTEVDWEERGPNTIGGRTRAVMFDPNNSTKIWAAGVNGGLWYNNDITSNTHNWNLVDGTWASLAVSSMAYDPNDTDVMYVGTGERFGASDVAATFTFSRKIVSGFSFGSSMKYISSKIWHSSASAFAVDLGVLVNTNFFSFTGKDKDGMNIGMSISNYGTRMKYDGIDNYQPIDISEFEEGNYGDVAGQFRTSEWELPLIFRIGFSIKPIVTKLMNLTLSADALHPNNNAESLNIGAALDNKIPGFGVVSLTMGAKSGMNSITKEDNDIGVTVGAGTKMFYLGNKSISIDYTYKTMGILGNVQVYTVGVSF